MATSTTTMRMPTELRDETARLAAQRESTMLDVVTEAIEQLRIQLWWDTVRGELDSMGDDDIDEYQRDGAVLDAVTPDGIA